MNTDDAMINEIKELSKKLVDDNISFPNEMDYFLIEQAMLRGASIAFESMIKEPKEKLHKYIIKVLTEKNNHV